MDYTVDDDGRNNRLAFDLDLCFTYRPTSSLNINRKFRKRRLWILIYQVNLSCDDTYVVHIWPILLDILFDKVIVKTARYAALIKNIFNPLINKNTIFVFVFYQQSKPRLNICKLNFDNWKYQ